MKHLALLGVFFFLLGSCKSLDGKKACFTTLSFDERYTLLLPCKYRKEKDIGHHGEKQYIFSYKDGSVFYISDEAGSYPYLIYNYLNESEQSSFTFKEELSYEGKDDNNNTWWKVIKKEGKVFGYLSVPESRK